MKRYENLEEAMCKELDKLDKKYATDVPEMSIQDVQRADVLYHALKSAATYHAMKDAEEEWEDEAEPMASKRSYARKRDAMGRYRSGDMMEYPDHSGHYPDWTPPYYRRY